MPHFTYWDDEYGNPELDPIAAVHYSIGVEQQIFENVEFGLEGFFKDISGLVVRSDRMVERNGELVPERFSNDGAGEVLGMELLLKHNPTDRFFGWVSYTMMRSRRVDHPGERERLFDYDQTHILNIVASAVLGRGWEAGVRFRLASGNPYTPVIDSVYDADSDIYMPVYGETNTGRLPIFHQLDVRVDKRWEWKYLKVSVYLDVQNVYNRKNVEKTMGGTSINPLMDAQNEYNQNSMAGDQYNYDYTKRRYFYGLPILPSLGLKLEY